VNFLRVGNDRIAEILYVLWKFFYCGFKTEIVFV